MISILYFDCLIELYETKNKGMAVLLYMSGFGVGLQVSGFWPSGFRYLPRLLGRLVRALNV